MTCDLDTLRVESYGSVAALRSFELAAKDECVTGSVPAIQSRGKGPNSELFNTRIFSSLHGGASQIMSFAVITPTISLFRTFGGHFCLHLQGDWIRFGCWSAWNHNTPKRRNMLFTIHGLITQNSGNEVIILILSHINPLPIPIHWKPLYYILFSPPNQGLGLTSGLFPACFPT